MEKRTIENKRKTNIYVIGSACLIILVSCIIAFFAYTSKLRKFAEETTLQKNNMSNILNNALDLENNTIESASSKIGKKVEELEEDNKNNTTVKVNNTKTQIDKNTNKENKSSSKTNTVEVIQDDVQDPVFLMPIEKGKISKQYASDNLIYSETLEEWITHKGIDIKADKATVVKASAAGTITDIKNDPRYGLSVIIEHTNGYKTIYSNLLTAEFIKKGESVTQGQTLGTVGNTATFEVADESHLHFEILKDDENVDPEVYLAE